MKNLRLGKAIKFLDLSQKDFADILGFNKQKITDLVNGKQNITDEIALLLEEKVNINKYWLLFNEGSMFASKNKDLKLLQEESNKNLIINKIDELEKSFLKRIKELKSLI